MNAALTRFFALPLPDQLATFEAVAALLAARVRLTLVPQSKSSQWLRPKLGAAPVETKEQPADACATIVRIRSAVQRASRRVPGASCLVQAIAGHRMLGSRGIQSRIRIGVEKTNDVFGAHAWLTVGDTTVLGGPDAAARFVELSRPQ